MKEEIDKHIQDNSDKNIEKKSDVFFKTIIPSCAVLVVALIGAYVSFVTYGILPNPFDEEPIYSVEKSVVSSQTPIVIVANNNAAQHREKLDIKFDDHEFNKGGIPHLDETVFQWNFLLSNHNLPEELVKDGKHILNIRLPNGKFSSGITVSLFTQSPILQAVIKDSDNFENAKVVEGFVASKLQDPEEEIKMEVIYYNEGTSYDFPIEVNKRTDHEGRYYFTFQIEDMQIPEFAQDDPKRAQDFFSLKITDMAGNTHYDTMSYEQYIARGERKFGINSLVDIKAKNIEGVMKDSFSLNFIVTPRIQKMETLVDGQPAIVLKVKGRIEGGKVISNELTWEMAEKIRQKKPIAIIMRNNKKHSLSFENKYRDTTPEKESFYQIVAKGKDGKRYVSNKAFESNKLGSGQEEALHLTNVSIEEGPGWVRVNLAGNVFKKFKHFRLSKPSRVVIDLMGVKMAFKWKTMNVDSPYLKKIRMAEHPGLTRMVIDMSDGNAWHYKIERTKEGLSVMVIRK